MDKYITFLSYTTSAYYFPFHVFFLQDDLRTCVSSCYRDHACVCDVQTDCCYQSDEDQHDRTGIVAGLIVAIVIALLLGGILAIILFNRFCKHRKVTELAPGPFTYDPKSSLYKPHRVTTSGSQRDSVRSVDKLLQQNDRCSLKCDGIWNYMRDSSNEEEIAQQFNNIRNNQSATTEVADQKWNTNKHHFLNIKAYDHSRY